MYLKYKQGKEKTHQPVASSNKTQKMEAFAALRSTSPQSLRHRMHDFAGGFDGSDINSIILRRASNVASLLESSEK